MIVVVFWDKRNDVTDNTQKYPYSWYQYYVISLLIAPLGALIRWQLGANLNAK